MEGRMTRAKTWASPVTGTAVGSTLVVDFWRAWRCDIDGRFHRRGVPPLFNELKVRRTWVSSPPPNQRSIRLVGYDATPQLTTCPSPKPGLGGSKPVGTSWRNRVLSIEWLLPVEIPWMKETLWKSDYGGAWLT